MITEKDLKDLSERIQDGLITMLGDLVDKEDMDAICQIVVDQVNDTIETEKEAQAILKGKLNE